MNEGMANARDDWRVSYNFCYNCKLGGSVMATATKVIAIGNSAESSCPRRCLRGSTSQKGDTLYLSETP